MTLPYDPNSLYDMQSNIVSRAITFENPTGAPGQGGKAENPLGIGRKGAPSRGLAAGEEVELANISGSGTIRHIWMTTFPVPRFLRGAVIRFYWDGQSHPSIEAPIGDFFGMPHGKAVGFQSAVHSAGRMAGMNIWLPMPFVTGARVTLTNELDEPMPVFYQIDYTEGEPHAETVGRLHVIFRRENPTTLKQDFELLPQRDASARYIGSVMGVRPLGKSWWGEGEMKVYMDGDTEFPTIVGTGAEDYIGLSWGIQNDAHLYHGANWKEEQEMSETGRVSMYRWHLVDPICWQQQGRITIQQIGHAPNPDRPTRTFEDYMAGLFEREDDWSAATFWYETLPSAPLPTMSDVAARIADLPEVAAKRAID